MRSSAENVPETPPRCGRCLPIHAEPIQRHLQVGRETASETVCWWTIGINGKRKPHDGRKAACFSRGRRLCPGHLACATPAKGTAPVNPSQSTPDPVGLPYTPLENRAARSVQAPPPTAHSATRRSPWRPSPTPPTNCRPMAPDAPMVAKPCKSGLRTRDALGQQAGQPSHHGPRRTLALGMARL